MVNIEPKVIENRRFPNDNSILVVEAPEIAASARPGQFVMAALKGASPVPSPLLKRALAVFTVSERDGVPTYISMVVKTVGEGTRRLNSSGPGDRLEMIGPLGNGFDLERARGKANFLIVGGTGIASVYLLASQLLHAGEQVHLVYGGRSAQDLVGLDEFEKLDLPITTTTEDGSHGFHGLVTGGFLDLLQKVPEDLANIYTCGPNPMMKAVTEIAAHHEIPCQISVEMKMACGFGVCLGCTVKTTDSYRLACTHGPIFDAAEFVWEKPMEGAVK